MVETLHWKFSQ